MRKAKASHKTFKSLTKEQLYNVINKASLSYFGVPPQIPTMRQYYWNDIQLAGVMRQWDKPERDKYAEAQTKTVGIHHEMTEIFRSVQGMIMFGVRK